MKKTEAICDMQRYVRRARNINQQAIADALGGKTKLAEELRARRDKFMRWARDCKALT